MVDGSGSGGSPPRFELLGPLRAWRGEDELDLGTAKQRAVLTILLINANRPVAVAAIIEAVWQGDPPENGANVVQKYVAGLRRVFEPDRSPRSPGLMLTLSEAGYRLAAEADRLDAELFHRYGRAARTAQADGRLSEAIHQLQAALTLWRGVPFAGLSGPAFDGARERFTESRAATLELWADLELQGGNHAQLVTRLFELVTEFPLREELRYLLILALYRCGRQAEALAAFRETRQLLADEFGVEPGERLQDLHRGILRSDPVLLVNVVPLALVGASAPAPGSLLTAPPIPTPPTSWSPVGPRIDPAPAPVPASVAAGPPVWAPPPLALSGVTAWPQRASFPRWLAVTFAILIPVLSFGLASWAVIGYYAVRNRSRALAGAAAVYLMLVFYFGFAIEADNHRLGTWASTALLALLTCCFGGVAQGLLLALGPPAKGWPDPAAWAAAARREQARELVHGHPAIARELRIGRPDLPRSFDDGGLVDLNSAPVGVLAAVPGLPSDLARRIVADRTSTGPMSSVDDLIQRRLASPTLAVLLWESLVAVPPS